MITYTLAPAPCPASYTDLVTISNVVVSMPRWTDRTCQFCGNSYTRREHYERHVRTHTRERPFDCAQCPSSFARRDTWRRHMRACHSIEDPVRPTSSAIGEAEPATAFQAQSSVSASTSLHRDDTEIVLADAPDTFDIEATAPDLSTLWQWDASLDLDPAFSLENLGTYDMSDANPSLPWIPLRPHELLETSHRSEHQPQPSTQAPLRWFTHAGGASLPHTPTRSSDLPSSTSDELSRDALAESLQQRVPDTTLPSTRFLNRCIYIFTTRLWHLVPIIHLPTFQPSQSNPLLLLSICSLGALAEGSQDALYHAERLYNGIHKAILVSTTPGNLFAIEHTLGVLQAAAIGQMFALLSGRPWQLMTAQLYHGTLALAVVALQRAMTQPSSQTSATAPGADPEKSWLTWVQSQSVMRLLNVVNVINGEICAILHAPASVRASPFHVQNEALDSEFLAKTHVEWTAVHSHISPKATPSALLLCTTIECFAAELSHVKVSPFECIKEQNIKALLESFCSWLDEFVDLLTTDSAQQLSTLMLCHSFFIQALCDMDGMEKACGRDGAVLQAEHKQILTAWASTSTARRGVSHAICIATILERFRIAEIPALHVARTSWHAGLVLAVYSFFAPAHETADKLELCPEWKTLQRTSLYTEKERASARNDITAEKCRTVAFSLSSMLRHLGPWQNSARYADTLDQVLEVLEPS